MMILTPLDDQIYEVAQKEIGYAKLFPYILEDFISRKDAKEMMNSSNLPVSTMVSTQVNTILAGAAGPYPLLGTGIGSGNGSGNGQALPIYNGSFPTPASKAMEIQKEAIVNAGGNASSKAIGSI